MTATVLTYAVLQQYRTEPGRAAQTEPIPAVVLCDDHWAVPLLSVSAPRVCRCCFFIYVNAYGGPVTRRTHTHVLIRECTSSPPVLDAAFPSACCDTVLSCIVRARTHPTYVPALRKIHTSSR